MRAAGPGQLTYWEREVDPDRELPEQGALDEPSPLAELTSSV